MRSRIKKPSEFSIGNSITHSLLIRKRTNPLVSFSVDDAIWDEGRKNKSKVGRMDGWMECRKEGRKEVREEGRKEGR